MAKSENKAAEIRVIKKKKAHAAHHGGAWKVAYADFVTAMMAFFMVMWILGLSEPIKQNIAGYFTDPEAFAEAVAEGENPGGGGPPVLSKAEEREKLKEAKETIEKMMAATPEFKELSKHVDIKLVDEGLMIDLVEVKESLFFASGSAKVNPATNNLLSKIAGELKKLDNKVIIEGHTDSRPLARPDDYTNWELSADRANSARRVMEAAGLKKDQIAHVRGCAATQLRDPKNPEHFSNRRVSIIVMHTDALKKQQLGVSKTTTEQKKTPKRPDKTSKKSRH